MTKTIAVLPGDGVGPEVVAQAIKVFKKIAQKYTHKFIFKYGLIGACAIDKTGNPLPGETLTICRQSDAIILGAVGNPKYDNDSVRPEQGLLKLRKKLDLFVNIRPVRTYPELVENSPLKNDVVKSVDLIVVRELTGGIYFGKPRERKDKGKTAVDTSIYTKEEVIRISHIAYQLAEKRMRKVTSVDKANVLETSRLWRETVKDVAKDYPDVELTHMYVDNCAMQLVKNPSQFDIVLTENMFGDILSDEASVLAGSIGLLPSASLGKKYALYEPIHGAYNKAAGKNIANPIGTILSAAMMLRLSFNLEKEAKIIEDAVEKVIKQGYRTKDIAGKDTTREKILGTRQMGDLISEVILQS